MLRRHALSALLATPSLWSQDIATVHPETVAETTLKFFSPAEFAALEKLASQIIPSVGGRAGAIEAGAPRFLDFLLSKSLPKDQQAYRAGLAKPGNLALLERPWTYAEPADPQERFLKRLKDDLFRATANSREWAAGRRGAGVVSYFKAAE